MGIAVYIKTIIFFTVCIEQYRTTAVEAAPNLHIFDASITAGLHSAIVIQAAIDRAFACNRTTACTISIAGHRAVYLQRALYCDRTALIGIAAGQIQNTLPLFYQPGVQSYQSGVCNLLVEICDISLNHITVIVFNTFGIFQPVGLIVQPAIVQIFDIAVSSC